MSKSCLEYLKIGSWPFLVLLAAIALLHAGRFAGWTMLGGCAENNNLLK